MRIAIASVGNDETSDISLRAGRCACYLIFDESGELLESLANPFQVGGGGAGFGVAKMLADRGIDLVIAGQFGPNMIGAMEERSLKYKVMTGKVSKALERALKENKRSDEGHA